MTIPDCYKSDMEKAIDILKAEGCSEIYLFGSIANGDTSDGSDIDIAIKGLPKVKYFAVYGKLMSALDHEVDLVMLEVESHFTKHLIEKGNLQRVA